MQKFELLLKNEKTRFYDRITVFIILINLALFILFAIRSEEKRIRVIGIVASLLITVFLFIRFFLEKGKKDRNNIYSYISLNTASIAWIATGNWWAAILNSLLSLLYRISKRPLTIIFTTENIKYASFPGRSIVWAGLNNAILKDGILTIDFKNNKIIQAEIDEKDFITNEKEFNDFCREQLSALSKK